jgi:hypothetical protein
MAKGVLDPSSLPLEVMDAVMLGKPACSLAYKLNMGGQRFVPLIVHLALQPLH